MLSRLNTLLHGALQFTVWSDACNNIKQSYYSIALFKKVFNTLISLIITYISNTRVVNIYCMISKSNPTNKWTTSDSKRWNKMLTKLIKILKVLTNIFASNLILKTWQQVLSENYISKPVMSENYFVFPCILMLISEWF